MKLENRSLITVYLTDEARQAFKKLDELRPKDVSFSKILGISAKDYVARYGMGTCKIEDFVDSNSSATPQFFSEINIWKKYIMSLDQSRYNEFSKRLDQFNNIKRIKIGGMLSW